MKRIPSSYKVYERRNGEHVVFRSWLESRWAYLFDTLGMEWAYEPAILDFQGIYYVPDFYVEEIGFIEIKPTWKHLLSESFEKLKVAARELEKTDQKLYSFCHSEPTLGFNSASRAIIQWDSQYIKQIIRPQFISLLIKASTRLDQRATYEETNSTLEALIHGSQFAADKPMLLKHIFVQLIHEYSANSVNEVPAFLDEGIIARKTMANIINGHQVELDNQISEMYQFSA